MAGFDPEEADKILAQHTNLGTEKRRLILRALTALVVQDDITERLGQAAFDAYLLAGADPDGARTWQQFFTPLVSPSWAEVVGTSVREAIETEEEHSLWLENKLQRIEAVLEQTIYLPGSTHATIDAIIKEPWAERPEELKK